MSHALDRFDRAQRDAAIRMDRAAAGGRDTALDELAETACLLELSGFDAVVGDPLSAIQQALDVVVLMGVAGGAAARLSLPGLADVELVAGAPIRPTSVVHAAPITVEGEAAGRLVLAAAGEVLDPEGLVAAVAAQVSAVLGVVALDYCERRDDAVDEALMQAADLDPDDVLGSLDVLADTLALLPGTVAVELIIDHPVIGAPATLRGGVTPGSVRCGGTAPAMRLVAREMETGIVALRRWGPALDDPDGVAAVEAVLEQVDASLSAIADSHDEARAAGTDPLSGLGTEPRLEWVLVSALDRASRLGEYVSVLVVSLDGFDEVHDTLGHDVGDLVLRACGRCLQQVTTGYDEIARTTTDEIVIVSPGADPAVAHELAEVIHRELPAAVDHVLVAGGGLGIAIGVATFPEAATDPAGLLAAAGAAGALARTHDGDGIPVAIAPAAAGPSRVGSVPRRADRSRAGTPARVAEVVAAGSGREVLPAIPQVSGPGARRRPGLPWRNRRRS